MLAAAIVVKDGMEDIPIDREIQDMAIDEVGSTKGLDRLIRIKETLIVSSTGNQT